MFRRTISLNIFEVLYEALLSLGMMIDVNILKYDGQYPKSIHVLIKFLWYNLLLMMALKCLQDSLSDSGVKALLHLLTDILNSFSEMGI